MERHAIQWAELHLDCYAGDGCDEIKPRWKTSSEGDKGDSDYIDGIALDCRHFPPGTMVTIAVPRCPGCGLPRDTSFNHQTEMVEHEVKCDCGFDWGEWSLDQYS